MICRVWHGWTAPGNADAYERLLRTEIIPAFHARSIDGFVGMQVLRRDTTPNVEFVTLTWFRSLDALRVFAGEDYEQAVVPPRARELLLDFDQRATHYQVAEAGPLPAPGGGGAA